MIDEGITEFRDTFLRRGWRGAEKNFGSCTQVNLKHIARAGGPSLLAERAAVQRCGRRAGGGQTQSAVEIA